MSDAPPLVVQLAVNWVAVLSLTDAEEGVMVQPVAAGEGAGPGAGVSVVELGGTDASVESVVLVCVVAAPVESAAPMESAANAMPTRARTTNTDNIDEPFFMYTTLSHFAFYLFIIPTSRTPTISFVR